jgi:hypothetical protein
LDWNHTRKLAKLDIRPNTLKRKVILADAFAAGARRRERRQGRGGPGSRDATQGGILGIIHRAAALARGRPVITSAAMTSVVHTVWAPMIGFFRSSSVKPMALSMARAGARSRPWSNGQADLFGNPEEMGRGDGIGQ